MTFAIIDDGKVVVRRDSQRKIVIYTDNPLSDEQMQDLYMMVYVMSQTGKRMEDIAWWGNELERGQDN